MSTKEKMEQYIVEVDKTKLRPGEKCFFCANGQINNGIDQKVTTKSKPSGLGLGVVLPVTKHLGIGISRHKVRTTTTVETRVNLTPCTLYLTSERYLVERAGGQESIEFKKVRGQKLYADCLELKYGMFGKIQIMMSHSDLERFKNLSEVIAEAAKEGVDLNSLTESNKETLEKGNSGGLSYEINYNKLIKAFQGDYAKTLFLWSLSRKPYPIHPRDEYPSYLYYQCGIQNAPKYHEELIKQGYFRPATRAEMLSTYKVDQLKEILSNHELEAKGKKQVLIERIIENIPEDTGINASAETYYVLSESGRTFLDNHDDCVQLHNHGNLQISWDTYQDARRKVKNGSFFDVCRYILDRRLINDPKMMQLNRNTFLSISELYHGEGNHQQELEYLLRVLYLDMNDKDRFFFPGLVKSIGDLSEHYSPDMIGRVCSSVKLSSTRMNAEKFGVLVQEIMDGTLKEGKYVRKS